MRTASKRLVLALVSGLLVVPSGEAMGQVAWDGPLMVSPSAPSGWGLYLSNPSPGGGIGVFSTWRAGGPLGFRAGLAEDSQEKLAVFGGVDMSGTLVRATDDFPLDVDWVAGAGFGIGDTSLLSFPFGASIGRELETEGVWFNPYLTPRVVLDAYFGDDPPSDRLSLGLAVDIGIDVAFDPGWAVRFAGTFGDRRALGIGISFRVF